MATTKLKRPKAAEPESIDVRYDLPELPSAQHKAGLAGLLLQIDSMNERKAAGLIPPTIQVPEVTERSATTVVLCLTSRSVQDVFDDLYSAEVVEIRSASRWAGTPPKREELNPAPGPGGPRRWFVYDWVQPIVPFLRRFTDDGKEAWHELWRDMLWKVMRGRPTTRIPFNSRAKGEPTKEGGDAWRGLIADERAKGVGGRSMVEMAGAVMLGVQAVNAELVRFENQADHDLLLHFWPLVARVFAPEVINGEGNREPAGFVLAIPDVSDVVSFCRAYTRLLAGLGTERQRYRPYRPTEALISLPAQGALEFMSHLDELATRKVIAEGPSRYIAGVEFFHMVPVGQNVKLMAHGRVPPEDRLLCEYAGIRKHYRNPLFFSNLLLAVLRNDPWFAGFDSLLAQRDWPFFVHSTQERKRTPSNMVGFAWDADKRFEVIVKRHKDMIQSKSDEIADPEGSPDEVDRLIYSLVRSYVKERACVRSGVKPDDQEWWSKTAADRRDVCSKLFLELRSRNEDDFVRHFTATLGSVPQWLKEDEFLAVTAALMRPYAEDTGKHRLRTRDDVKTLTLLALSAHSRSYTPRDVADDPTSVDKETEQ